MQCKLDSQGIHMMMTFSYSGFGWSSVFMSKVLEYCDSCVDLNIYSVVLKKTFWFPCSESPKGANDASTFQRKVSFFLFLWIITFTFFNTLEYQSFVSFLFHLFLTISSLYRYVLKLRDCSRK